MPVYQQVRKELSEKTLGSIKLIRAEICWPLLKVERFQKPELGGGGLVNLGFYPVALACMVFGEMPESIKAVGKVTSSGEYLLGIRKISADNTISGTTVLSMSLGKTSFAWRFILNENILF